MLGIQTASKTWYAVTEFQSWKETSKIRGKNWHQKVKWLAQPVVTKPVSSKFNCFYSILNWAGFKKIGPFMWGRMKPLAKTMLRKRESRVEHKCRLKKASQVILINLPLATPHFTSWGGRETLANYLVFDLSGTSNDSSKQPLGSALARDTKK